MHLDVKDLAAFYQGPLGQVAARAVRRRLRALWPDVRRQRILGIGYATPFLAPFRQDAERVLALMPSSQGVMRWPHGAANAACLADEGHLPLPDAAFDRVLLIHVLETSETVRGLLREAWRVLNPEGRLLVAVPNRASLWARLERTPFGHGHPFTRGQLRRLLADSMFAGETWGHALFMPPFGMRAFLASAGAWEEAGRRLWPQFAGLHLVEARKEIYARPLVHPLKARLRLRASLAAAGVRLARAETRPPRPSSWRARSAA